MTEQTPQNENNQNQPPELNDQISEMLAQLPDELDDSQQAHVDSYASHVAAESVYGASATANADGTFDLEVVDTIFFYTDPDTMERTELRADIARALLGRATPQPEQPADAGAPTGTELAVVERISTDVVLSETVTIEASQWAALKDYVLTTPHITPALLVRFTNNERTRAVFPGLPHLTHASAQAAFEALQGTEQSVDKVTNKVIAPGTQPESRISEADAPVAPWGVRPSKLRRVLGRTGLGKSVVANADSTLQAKLHVVPQPQLAREHTAAGQAFRSELKAQNERDAALAAWELGRQMTTVEGTNGDLIISPRNPQQYRENLAAAQLLRDQQAAAEALVYSTPEPRERKQREYEQNGRRDDQGVQSTPTPRSPHERSGGTPDVRYQRELARYDAMVKKIDEFSKDPVYGAIVSDTSSLERLHYQIQDEAQPKYEARKVELNAEINARNKLLNDEDKQPLYISGMSIPLSERQSIVRPIDSRMTQEFLAQLLPAGVKTTPEQLQTFTEARLIAVGKIRKPIPKR